MKKLKSLFFDNLGLKLISLLLACLIWFIVVQAGDPTDSKTYSNIKVVFTNAQVLSEQGKVYEVMDNTDTVRVTIKAPRSVLDSLNESNIVAEADLSKLTDINTVAINCHLNTDDQFYSATANIEAVRLHVEDKATKYVPLSASIVGEVAEGYKYSSVTLDQNLIEISGPQSAVNMVRRSCVVVDVSEASSNMTANMEVTLLDADGNELNLSNVQKQTDYVRVSVEILSTKEVSIYASATGTPASGFRYTGEVIIEPAVVRVAGSASRIQNYSKINITDPVDLTGATEDVIVNVDLDQYLPANISLAEDGYDGMVQITFPIQALEYRSFTFSQSILGFENVPEGFSVTTAGGNFSVLISGLDTDFETFDYSNLTGTIDIGAWLLEEGLTELEEGTYEMPLELALPEGLGQVEETRVRVVVVKEDRRH
ncbi:MAG: hypothetical protein K5891_06465 [Lachnospiraceae bacterium]|nr:hypothetical protein [Lachnospiraceae bacterium]